MVSGPSCFQKELEYINLKIREKSIVMEYWNDSLIKVGSLPVLDFSMFFVYSIKEVDHFQKICALKFWLIYCNCHFDDNSDYLHVTCIY